MSNGDRNPLAIPAIAAGTAAGAVGVNTHRIADAINQNHTDRYSAKVRNVASAYGADAKGNKAADPRDIMPKDSAGRTIYSNKEHRQKVRAGNRVIVRNKYRMVHDLKVKRAAIPVTALGRNKITATSAALAVPLTIAGAHGTVKHPVKKRDLSHRDVNAGAAGGLAAAGAYQGGSYALKPLDRKNEAKIAAKPELKARADKYRKESGLPGGAPAGHPGWKKYFRNYPTDLPGGRMKRVLSHTHTGKTGVALTIGAGAAGTTGAVKLSQRGRKPVIKSFAYEPYEATNRVFSKSMYVRDTNGFRRPRTLEAGAGLGLLGYGATQSPHVGAALARGINQAKKGQSQAGIDALQRAQSAYGAMSLGMARGERAARQIKSVDQAITKVPAHLRPAIAAAAGLLLLGHARPARKYSYHPVNIKIRTGVTQ
jgi:hypothetical protein